MSQSENEERLLDFLDESEAPSALLPARSLPDPQERTWRVLVIDDEPDVHTATSIALKSQRLLERPVEILSAHSSAEARTLLMVELDIALILLDVVMESPTSGLDLVDFIRNDAGMRHTRIVLRTGQPGYAPELETLQRYDINDYKSKSELTRVKLLTAVLSGLRAYEQLCRIEQHRLGLEMVVQASATLLDQTGLQAFAEGVVTQLAALLHTHTEGLVCARSEARADLDEPVDGAYFILAAGGRFASLMQQPLGQLPDARVREALTLALQRRESSLHDFGVAIYFGSRDGADMAAFVATPRRLDDGSLDLLDVFCANLGACLRNVRQVRELEAQAFVDPALGLPNRLACVQALEHALRVADGPNRLTLLDVDHFSGLNDAFGHAHADRVLAGLVERLRQVLGAEQALFRIGPDLFAVLDHQDAAMRPALGLTRVNVPGHSQTLQLTLGQAMADRGLGDAHEWLNRAEMALRSGKHQGRGALTHYSADLGSATRQRATLLQRLRLAQGLGQLSLAFQPQVSLTTGHTVGFEALLRWRMPDGQWISPADFIPVAEASGLIIEIGDWVLAQSFQAAAELDALGLLRGRMACNISSLQLLDGGLPQRAAAAAARAGLDPSRLELEVTESVAVDGRGPALAQLRELRAMGFGVSLDDFGTGYSSLSQLDELPIDKLKIDRAFTSRLLDPASQRLPRLVVGLGPALGLRVVAEGVELPETVTALLALGCTEAQGYLFGRPMPLADLKTWLQDSAGRTPAWLSAAS